MLSPAVQAEVPAFKAKKQAQWERVKDSLHGLQLAVSGEVGTHFVLTCSPHDDSFYESIVFGQLPSVVLEMYGSPLNPMYRDIEEAKKPFEAGRIDLTDDQVDAVITAWRAGQSALSLPFIAAVYGIDGQKRVKP
jgi:hypothetical protein